jgi:hypothetical protein
MGAYNEVNARLPCPHCGRLVDTVVQFKYGAVTHHRYAIGDRLVWGANDVGSAGHPLVVVAGEGTMCEACHLDADWPVHVRIANGVITDVVSDTGEYDFVHAGEPYVILPSHDGK